MLVDDFRETVPLLPASIDVQAMTDLQHDDLGGAVVHGENDAEVTDAQTIEALTGQLLDAWRSARIVAQPTERAKNAGLCLGG